MVKLSRVATRGSIPSHSTNHSGAAEGCGSALQVECLVGFDTPGLHQVSAYMSSQCCGGNDGSISQSTQREIRRLALPAILECGVIPTVDANTI